MSGSQDQLDLPITGMTCASCASRIERRLNKVDGVQASVNYATEKAAVTFDPGQVQAEDLVAAVEKAGYRATLPAPPAREAGIEPPAAEEDPTRALRRRLVWSAVLSLPVLLLSMVPVLQFDNWQWLALQLATPVVLWAGWPFHRAAWANLRHGTATMDTLVSVGTLAAWGWSLVALFLGDAGMTGMTMGFDLIPDRSASLDDIYFEVAAVVTTFILGGRYFEARAKRRAGAALEALLELGAKDVAVLDGDGGERWLPIEELEVDDRPTRRRRPRPRRSAAFGRWACARSCSPVTAGRPPRPWRGRPASRRSSRRSFPPRRPTSSVACKRKGAS